MIEYWDLEKFIRKKADLYNYINPFFNLNYLESHNFFYLIYALDLYKSYLDNIYIDVDSNIRLDVNQKIAILTSSQNELIIAGAGSGKTTTIAAKIKFMVDILKIKPSDILLLSYTNEAVSEMQRIIVSKFKINVKILTFHKFAILLLNNHENIRETIEYESVKNNFSKIEKVLLFTFLYLFYDLTIIDVKKRDNKFKSAFNLFQNDYQKYYFENLKLKNNLKSKIFKYIGTRLLKRQITDTLTFDSLIYKASLLNEFNNKFKFILIDEYQDISNLRFSFIKKYADLNNSFLTCVGDDWQTIFSFASSNINNILNFSSVFSDSKILKITNTYRNSQELIDIAGSYIMTNEKQIKKRLKSKKHLNHPVETISYTSKENMIQELERIIDNIKDKSIAFLLRYKNDINDIIDNKVFQVENNKLIYKSIKEIYFYTIHASKGLGFDYVFVLNNKNGYYGFPPKRKQKSFFEEENIIFEERRLFYVALTRTKNKVYLLYPKRKHSLFLKEIKKMLKKNLNLL